jgi:hypothetical protein
VERVPDYSLYPYGLTEEDTRPDVGLLKKPKDLSEFIVYYESISRDPKIRGIYECICSRGDRDDRKHPNSAWKGELNRSITVIPFTATREHET